MQKEYAILNYNMNSGSTYIQALFYIQALIVLHTGIAVL